MADWYVGQKVVALSGRGNIDRNGDTHPVRGLIYTVRGICIEFPEISFWLEEIVNEHRQFSDGFAEISWFASSFRPVVEHKTDISIFHALLNPKPANRVKEDVE